jgi:hypothetical protein
VQSSGDDFLSSEKRRSSTTELYKKVEVEVEVEVEKDIVRSLSSVIDEKTTNIIRSRQRLERGSVHETNTPVV